jgi:uncharacterized membrane protein
MTSTKIRLQHRHRRMKALGYLTVGAGLAWIAFARQRSAPLRALAPKPVRRAITIAVPPEQVYAFWRDLANLPSFMPRLVSIEPIDPRRSQWRARGPAGKLLEWDAEIVEDVPDELIRWKSLPARRSGTKAACASARRPDRGEQKCRSKFNTKRPGASSGAGSRR